MDSQKLTAESYLLFLAIIFSSSAFALTPFDAGAQESGPKVTISKSVENPAPSDPLQTTEFRIEVSNIGDEPASEIEVQDDLPSDLTIPVGMAASTTTGQYDPISGNWEIGEMDPNTIHVMTIPVTIASEPQPACIINFAHLSGEGTAYETTPALAAIRRPDIPRCVNLAIYQPYGEYSQVSCGRPGNLEISMGVANYGIDPARDVILEVTETQFNAPGFEAIGCSGLRCYWDVIEPGGIKPVDLQSDTFEVQSPTTHVIEVFLSSDVEDYSPESNTRTFQFTIKPLSESCPPSKGPEWSLGGAGSGGGCFIATASYGSDLHPHVQTLRHFRDDVLLQYEWGQSLVKFYYRHSTDMACYIAEHDVLRLLVRVLLWPIVFAIAYPWAALVVFLAVLTVLGAFLRLHRRKSIAT